MQVSIFETKSFTTAPDDAVLFQRAFTVFGMNELKHSFRLQLFPRKPKRPLPGGVKPQEEAAEVSDTKHVDGKIEKAILQETGDF